MNERIKDLYTNIKNTLPELALSAISGWLCALTLTLLASDVSFTDVPDFSKSVSPALFAASALIFCALFFILNRFLYDRILLVILPVSFGLYGAVCIAHSASTSDARAYSALVFSLLSLAVIAICANFMKKREIDIPKGDISPRLSFIIVCSAFLLFSALYGYLLWTRTQMLCSPCYDMGIFAQMYDNMKEGFLPITTCERGESLSHLAVHFSPALYLLLPFCYIFEITDMLVLAQVLLVFSSVFPLWLICKRIGLSNARSAIVSVLLLIYPVMSSGAFYDFHENALLAPLILWTLYFVHAEKWIPTFIFALGVLAVKEDAAIYVAFIALYIIFSRKKYWQGSLMFLMTVGYFLFASHMLMQGGQGLMLGGRYYNIIGYDGSFADLIRVALLDPALYAVESLTPEKLLYALNMLLPPCLLPLATRKPSRWLLIAPLFVINLITDYKYQYDLGFQYSFGSGALLIYLAAINLADIYACPTSEKQECARAKMLRGISAAMLVFALFSSVFLISARIPSQFYYAKIYNSEARDDIERAKDVLDSIDRNASVAATSMYLTYLYDIDQLYHLNNGTGQIFDAEGNIKLYTDIAVIDLRDYVSDKSNAELWKWRYIQEGYEVSEYVEDVILVLERKK